MNVDLSGVEGALLSALGIVLTALAGWVAQRIVAWLDLKVSAQQSSALDSALSKSISFGLSQSQDLIKAKGWDHVDVKNQSLGLAASYLTANFPQALSGVGIDLGDKAALGAKVDKLLDRAFPAAATVVANSPVTPPVPPPAEPK